MSLRPSIRDYQRPADWLRPGTFVKCAASHTIFKVIGPAPSREFHMIYGEAIDGETMKQSLLVADLTPLNLLEALAVEGRGT